MTKFARLPSGDLLRVEDISMITFSNGFADVHHTGAAISVVEIDGDDDMEALRVFAAKFPRIEDVEAQ